MKIYRYSPEQDAWIPHHSLLDAFCFSPEENHIVSLVGGGGKTSLMYQLASEFAQHGQKVVATTTTKIRKPAVGCVVTSETSGGLRGAFAHTDVVTVGESIPPQKLSAPSSALFSEIFTLADSVLIEADGARMLPVKAPAAQEPVILPESTSVIAVAGLDAIGKPFSEICHRSELATALLGCRPDATVLPEHLGRLLSHPQGQRKGVLPQMRFLAVLNKADTPSRLETARQAAQELSRQGVSHIFATSFAKGGTLCLY